MKVQLELEKIGEARVVRIDVMAGSSDEASGFRSWVS